MTPDAHRYKWVALSNTTIGMLMATINSSIVLIALPDIFRGIHLDPLEPGNSGYLLWMLMGFLVATAVLVVSFGRIGDMYGRVRMFNVGFAVFTAGSVLLSLTWMDGSAAARWLIAMRIVQGIGGALLMANSSAILTDAFPPDERGLALGINAVSAIAGSFIGLVLGGVLAPVSWRLVFLVSVPVGILGTVWSLWKLEERGERHPAKVDWWGNLTFALGLILVMVSVTYGIRPYGDSALGWGSPRVIALLAAAAICLVAFVFVERRATNPMFELPLFRIRAFTFGTLSTFLSAVARGGLMFMLIIWLQGIWLPQHGYTFTETPLWAGIYMLPLTLGMLFAGPTSGYLSDRFGARWFAFAGMVGSALAFAGLMALPTDFTYPVFAAILGFLGLSMGMFASPNRAAIMNSLPKEHRGAGGAMNQTFQNSAQVLSIGIFFTLLIVGLASTLPHTMSAGLEAHGVDAATAQRVGALPPVSILFAAFLGYNPIQSLLGPDALHALTPANQHAVTGPAFFPQLISDPFRHGLHTAFAFAIVACLVAATASLLRGGRFHYSDVALVSRPEEQHAR